MRKKSDTRRQAILSAAYELFREKGFEKTSVAEINGRAGGSKATIYSYFRSKEEIFVECMFSLAERYLEEPLGKLQGPAENTDLALQAFGESFLRLVCSPEMVSLRRLMVAEAERAGIGKLFYEKLEQLRQKVAAFISKAMTAGVLRAGDADLAAIQLRALLEAELFEPLLLFVHDERPDEATITETAERAIGSFLAAYASVSDSVSSGGSCQRSSVEKAVS